MAVVRHSLCLVLPLPSWLKHCLCLVLPLPPLLRHCLCIAVPQATAAMRSGRAGQDVHGRRGQSRRCQKAHNAAIVGSFDLHWFLSVIAES